MASIRLAAHSAGGGLRRSPARGVCPERRDRGGRSIRPGGRGRTRIIPAGHERTVAVIPARFGSTRFPGKILHLLHGRTILARLLDRALSLRTVDQVLVATDDERIAEEARANGATAILTSSRHPSGSDRIGEAVAALSPAPGLVLNLQGDEPLFDPAAIERLLAAARACPDAIWTLADPIEDPAERTRPSVVKVVTARDGRALYFSRSAIPYDRAAAEGGTHDAGARAAAAGAARDAGSASFPLRHVGVYAYPRPLLEAFLAEPPGTLERIEGLEQLRALEIGLTIRVLVGAWPDAGIDTPEDLERILAKYPDEDALARAGRGRPDRG